MRPRYKALFERMRDSDPVAADAAFDAVLFDREHAVPDVVECYEKAKKDAVLRFLCIQLLGFSGAAAALPTILAALDDRDASVRAEACRSLEDLRAKESIPLLEARLIDVDESVRQAAREALDGILGGRSEE
jgi:HEAT repeat protein